MTMLKNYLMRGVCFAADDGGGGAGGGGQGGDKGGAGDQGTGDKGAGGDKGAAAAWYESKDLGLEDELKTYYAGKQYPDLKTALKSGREAENLARSRNVLEKPDPKKLTEWKGWTELGWTEDPAKYEIKAPDEKALRFKYDGELWGEFRKFAHENRIPLPAAQAIHDKMIEFWGKRMDALEAQGASAIRETEEALDKEWGADKERNREIARRAAKTFDIGIEDMAELDKVIGSPRLLKMFHAIGAKLGEASLVGDDARGGAGAPGTVAEIEAELNRLEADKDFLEALKDPRHRRHKDVTAQREQLIAKLAALKSKAA